MLRDLYVRGKYRDVILPMVVLQRLDAVLATTKNDAGAMHGGTMLYNTSPNDPVFFLHHANIDRLWAKWQERHGTTFPADAAGYTPASTMWPWFDRTIASLESTLDLGYRYDTAGS